MKKHKVPKNLNRREFIWKTSLASMALPSIMVHSPAIAHENRGTNVQQWRNKQSDMVYRQLGKTGYMISEVSVAQLSNQNFFYPI